MKIKKALITCAGFGTRFLPISKAIQKEMLPILNRPIIDYIVQDCILAGITEIIFVVKENDDQLVRKYYSDSKNLKQHLNKMGKLEKLAQAKSVGKNIKFTFITQTAADKYGTAVPVELAQEFLQDEDAFLVFMGDDFIFNPGTIAAKEMIQLFEESHSEALVTCIRKPESELHKYGVAQTKTEHGYTYLTNLVEKPQPGTAPSNLTNISKYIFTPKIFELLKTQAPDASSGEYYITDTATQLAQTNPVVIYTPTGNYLDGGTVLGWLKANLVVAKQDPEFQLALREFITQEF